MVNEEVLLKNRVLVEDYVNAMGNKEYKKLLDILDDNFEFEGAISLHGAGEFIKMLKDHEKNERTNIVLKNDIKAIFVDGNESYVIYDLVTKSLVGTVSVIEQVRIENGKILSTNLKFDRLKMKKLRDEVAKKEKN